MCYVLCDSIIPYFPPKIKMPHPLLDGGTKTLLFYINNSSNHFINKQKGVAK